MKTKFWLLAILTYVSIASTARTQRVLFIGNSYVYVNNLPQVIADMATSTNDTLLFDANAVGGYRLMDHSTDATTLSKIAVGNWDYVVLQEQSQMPSFPLGQVQTDVFPYAHLLDSIIHLSSPCAKTLFYMTWGRKNGDASNCGSWPPVCTYLGMDSLLRERYLMMANDNHALVAPAGPVWRKLRANNPTIELFQADESHPSEAGTYAIACAFYSIIFEKNPLNIPYNYTLSTNDAQAIRTAAKTVAFDSLAYWNVYKYLPNADFQFSSTANLQISFTNSSQYASSYNWSFGDGNTSTQTNPIHTYSNVGTYPVRLIATKCGKSDTSLQSVIVTPTGIQTTNEAVVTLYPNPVSKELHLEGCWRVLPAITITDAIGNNVPFSCTKKDNQLNISTEHFAAGFYTIVLALNGTTMTAKFEKK